MPRGNSLSVGFGLDMLVGMWRYATSLRFKMEPRSGHDLDDNRRYTTV